VINPPPPAIESIQPGDAPDKEQQQQLHPA
jgi:hypothetical protein